MAEVGEFLNLAAGDLELGDRRREFEGAVTAAGVSFHSAPGGGNYNNYDPIAEVMVRRNPAVLVASCYKTMWALARKTDSIPIVYAALVNKDGERIGPDGKPYYYANNVTGIVSFQPTDLCRWWPNLLLQVAPTLNEIAVVNDLANSTAQAQYQEIRGALPGTFSLPQIDVTQPPGQLRQKINEFKKHHPQGGLIVTAYTWTTIQRDTIISAAAANYLPAIYPCDTFVNARRNKGLIAYGPNLLKLYQSAAGHVNQILQQNIPANQIRATVDVQINRTFYIYISGGTFAALFGPGNKPPHTLNVNGQPIPTQIVA
jgi:ABC-type uncharacterized transport system substrate-binding protein